MSFEVALCLQESPTFFWDHAVWGRAQTKRCSISHSPAHSFGPSGDRGEARGLPCSELCGAASRQLFSWHKTQFIAKFAGFCLNSAGEFERRAERILPWFAQRLNWMTTFNVPLSSLAFPRSTLLTFPLRVDLLWQELLSVRKNSRLKSLCCGKPACL